MLRSVPAGNSLLDCPEFRRDLDGTIHLTVGAVDTSHLLLTIRRRTFILSSVRDQTTDLVQGTLDMLVLKTLALEPMHGFGVGVRIEQISNGVFRVNAGSLFSALNRLERGGRIKADWRATENNRRAKYYSLTERGRKALHEETRQWGRQAGAIARILEA